MSEIPVAAGVLAEIRQIHLKSAARIRLAFSFRHKNLQVVGLQVNSPTGLGPRRPTDRADVVANPECRAVIVFGEITSVDVTDAAFDANAPAPGRFVLCTQTQLVLVAKGRLVSLALADAADVWAGPTEPLTR